MWANHFICPCNHSGCLCDILPFCEIEWPQTTHTLLWLRKCTFWGRGHLYSRVSQPLSPLQLSQPVSAEMVGTQTIRAPWIPVYHIRLLQDAARCVWSRSSRNGSIVKERLPSSAFTLLSVSRRYWVTGAAFGPTLRLSQTHTHSSLPLWGSC